MIKLFICGISGRLGSSIVDELKKAYEELLDKEKRELTIKTVDTTRAATARERRKLLSKGMKESDFEPLDVKLDKDVMKAFAGEYIRCAC